MRRVALFCRLLCFLFAVLSPGVTVAAERTVVVVLFDGFSPAMVDAAKTPNFDRIREEGVWSDHLVPAFPTISLTNHTTFATGCWPARHGIVSNIFFDPELGRYDHARDADWLTGCETMWQAAERQGKRAAVLGFTARHSGTRGDLASHVDKEVQWEKWGSDMRRAKQVIKLLKQPVTKRPSLIVIYLKGPDSKAHFNGTTAPETIAVVEESDAVVGMLMDGISSLSSARNIALVIGTDHGMRDVGPLINIGRIVNEHEIKARVAASGASAYLYLDKDEDEARVIKSLSEYSDAFTVYKKGEYPAFAHVGEGPRAGDLLIVAKPPYWLEGPEVFPDYAHWLGITTFWPSTFTPPFGGVKATHGYAPSVSGMHGIFYAWGSGVARGKEIKRLRMIDVHPTVMALLGLEAGRPVDGKVAKGVLAGK